MLRTEPLGVGVGLRLYGELADINAVHAGKTFDRLAEIGGEVTLDLAGVTFMDSMGLGKLIVLAVGLTGRGHLRLVNVRPPLVRVFELVSPRRPLPNMTIEPIADVASPEAPGGIRGAHERGRNDRGAYQGTAER